MEGKRKAVFADPGCYLQGGLPQFVKPWSYAHTVSPRKKGMSESFIGSTFWWSGLRWRYKDESSHNGESLTKSTNKAKIRKYRDRKENPKSPRA